MINASGINFSLWVKAISVFLLASMNCQKHELKIQKYFRIEGIFLVMLMLFLVPSVFSVFYFFPSTEKYHDEQQQKMITRNKYVTKYEQERVAITLQRQDFQLLFDAFWNLSKIQHFKKSRFIIDVSYNVIVTKEKKSFKNKTV